MHRQKVIWPTQYSHFDQSRLQPEISLTPLNVAHVEVHVDNDVVKLVQSFKIIESLLIFICSVGVMGVIIKARSVNSQQPCQKNIN